MNKMVFASDSWIFLVVCKYGIFHEIVYPRNVLKKHELRHISQDEHNHLFLGTPKD
jgi:hypothetical protein